MLPVAALVVTCLLLVAFFSVRAHLAHQSKAKRLESDLLADLSSVSNVHVLAMTAKHSVSAQEGGSSDCEADATVQVKTRLSAAALTALLNSRTASLATVSQLRPGLLLVNSHTPLGSATLDWDC